MLDTAILAQFDEKRVFEFNSKSLLLVAIHEQVDQLITLTSEDFK